MINSAKPSKFVLSLTASKAERKAGSLYEGNGLSVSVSPDAWEAISKLGGSESYVLEKDGPRCADGMDDETFRAALEWCVQENVLTKANPGK